MQYMQQVINNQGMTIEQILPIKVPENIDENKKEDQKNEGKQPQENEKTTENGGNE